jgi:flavodoxin
VKTLIVCLSEHHGNTKKVADEMAAVLHADIASPDDLNTATIGDYDLIGFGSGIAFGKHYKGLRKVVARLTLDNKKVFIFSTRGAQRLRSYHNALKKQLEKKGATIVGEFSCRGFDTYGITKLVGGIAKGRPNEQDLFDAKEFARSLEKAE